MNATKAKSAVIPEIVITRTFDAPREVVFKAWTDPKEIIKWWSPEPSIKVPSIRTDVKVGGRFRIQMQKPDGEYFTAVGSYREVKPPERLVFTWDWEKDGSGTEFGEAEGNTTVMTLDFVVKGKQTELTLRHSEFASADSRNNHEKGWSACLDRMAQVVKAK